MGPNAKAVARSRPGGPPVAWLVWAVPALVTLLVGMWRIGTPGLWRDEVASWVAADRGVGELFGMLRHVDASAGAYYLLLHGWMGLFGDSPTALRSLSALAMAGAAAFTALAARRLFGSAVAGAAAGLLFAVPPTVTRYAQEVRVYALVACAAAAAVWLLLRALERPSARRWAAFGALTVVSGALHLVSLAALVGQVPLVLLAAWRPDALGAPGQEPERGPRRALLWQYALTAALSVVALLPLILLGSSQVTRQISWVPHPTPELLRLFWDGLFSRPELAHLMTALAVIGLLLPGRRLAGLGAVLLAVLPVLAVYQVSRGSTSYFLDRYLLFTVSSCALAAGGGVAALYRLLRRALRGLAGRRRAVAAGVLAAALVAGAVLPALYTVRYRLQQVRLAGAHDPTDFRGAAQVIADGYRPGDALAAVGADTSWAMVGPSVDYYLRAMHPGPGSVFTARTAVQQDDLFPSEDADPRSALAGHRRLWLVNLDLGNGLYQGFSPAQAAALRSGYTVTETFPLRGLTVALLTSNT